MAEISGGGRKLDAILLLVSLAVGAIIVGEGYRVYAAWRGPAVPEMLTPGFSWDGVLEKDPLLLWGMTPNSHMEDIHTAPNGTQHIWSFHLNSHGIRGEEAGEKNGRYRILCIGDSTTFGIHMNDDETWPARLQELLDPAAKRIQVINGGVPGTTVMQGYGLLARERLTLHPDLLIVTYGFNDGSNPGFSDLKIAAENLGAGNPVLAHDIVRAIDPNPLPAAEDKPSRVSQGEFVDLLLATASLAKRNGCRVLFLGWPLRATIANNHEFKYYNLTQAAALNAGVDYLDLLPVFRAAPEIPLSDDIHATREGCQLVAESLRDYLRENKVIPD